MYYYSKVKKDEFFVTTSKDKQLKSDDLCFYVRRAYYFKGQPVVCKTINTVLCSYAEPEYETIYELNGQCVPSSSVEDRLEIEDVTSVIRELLKLSKVAQKAFNIDSLFGKLSMVVEPEIVIAVDNARV